MKTAPNHTTRIRDRSDFEPGCKMNQTCGNTTAFPNKPLIVVSGPLKDGSGEAVECYKYAPDVWTEAEAANHSAFVGGTFEAAAKPSSDQTEMPDDKGLTTPAMFSRAWAILPEALIAFENVWNLGIKVGLLDEAAKAQRAAVRKVSGNTVVLGLRGLITQRLSAFMSFFFGGTSTEEFGQAFDNAINDDSVGAIVLDVDSPGGSVYGVQELSDKIYAARGRKPIIAIVNSLAASAAYWIASAADQVVIMPSGEAGSIGVIAMHSDISEAESQAGINVTLIYAGRFKTEGTEHEPLGDDARGAIQARVDDYYSAFIKAVARNRGVTTKVASTEFGQGRVMGAADAKAAGMVDRVATFEETVQRLQGTGPSRTSNMRKRNQLAVERFR